MITLCVISLFLCIKYVAGQVVIVPDKRRAPRTSVKSKDKPNPKTREMTASASSSIPAPKSAPPRLPALQRSAPVNLSIFTILRPPPFRNLPSRESEARVPPPTRLTEYVFEVITSDARGRVIDTRRASAWFFTEGLNGGEALEMVEIPGGMYLMGTSSGELAQIAENHGRGVEKDMKEMLPERLRWETPQHAVKLPAFYLSKYEITQAQWRAVAMLPRVKKDLMRDPSYFKGGPHPVEMVSWDDAIEFCERLSRATGRNYRLPTEAEWEYACRAGSMSPFHFGEAMLAAWANYEGGSPYADAPRSLYRQKTIPVGSLGSPNAFGIYDMHGNVWEWCLDTWHENYFQAPEDGRSWERVGDSFVKVIRGGAWNSFAGECRAGARNRITSPFKRNEIGFRVVAEVEGRASR